MALVGAPNVGKSSLVQALSSGTPEVCDYPFTTRSVKMGHFYVDGRRHQVRMHALCACAQPAPSPAEGAAARILRRGCPP